jgi:serine/threonine-protein kinase
MPNALAIAIGVCAGLHYAHERVVDGRPLDLVHRDVSPQNAFITYDGGVKLLDFGIARASSRLSETRGGTLKGKISYMSPEQCGGYPLDRRSDVFAAAIILWEMTVGRRLFSGSSDFEILRKVKEEDAQRPSSVVSDYPRALEEIVMKGLARDREHRYATAEDMQVDLETFARDRKLAVSPVPLGRFVRELFKSELEAWQAAERAGQPGEPVAQTTPSGNLIRTETSISGPVPPMLAAHTDPSLSPPIEPPPLPKRHRGAIAVVLGVLAGSLITWLLVRPASVPAPAIVTSTQPAAVAAPKEVEAELPAPASPVAAPVALPTARATTAPAAKRAPVHKVAKKPMPKKLPPGWDPESLLPP